MGHLSNQSHLATWRQNVKRFRFFFLQLVMILAMILQSATNLQPNTHHIPPPVPAPLAQAHPQQVVEAAHQRAHESVVVQKKRTSMAWTSRVLETLQ